MSYQVLARKWRPRSFASLVGQEHVIKALSNALENQRLHHAYLLTGTRGVGKTTIARILAKSLNCEAGISATPCGECSACLQIDAGRFVDLLEIDAASNTGIDNIREVLDNAQYSPTQGRFKVYIIDEVHMLSKSAFNAMLKTLEEPPGHVKFILATTDPQKVPVTILSRCLQFSLRQMLPTQVSGHLHHVLQAEAIPFEPAALTLIGHAAAGSMRDALSLLDQAIAYGSGKVQEHDVRAMLGAVDQSYLFSLLQALLAQDGSALLEAAAQLAQRGIAADSALQELAAVLHLLATYQTVPTAIASDHPHFAQISTIAPLISPEDVQLYYQIALHGRRDLGLAPDEAAGLSMCLLRMLAFSPRKQRPLSHSEPVQQPSFAKAADPAPQPLIDSPPPPLEIPPWEDVAMEPDINERNINLAEPRQFNGDWAGLVLQLKLGGQAGMLAQHAQLLRYNGLHFELQVPEAHRVVAAADYRERLIQALSQYFGSAATVTLNVGGGQEATPAAQQQRVKAARLSDAVQAVNQDPFIQTLISEFGGTVLPDSIQAHPDPV